MFNFKRWFSKSEPPKSEPPYPSTAPFRTIAGCRRIPVPERITTVHVPLAVLEATSRIMREFGRERRECYVWWGGSFAPPNGARVATAYCPKIATSFGRIELDTAAYARLHRELRDRDQVLIAELHSHPPGAGGQNPVDAANGATTYRGFLTIVVPNFANPRFHDLRRAHVYEYEEAGRWRALTSDDIQRKFIIHDTFVLVK